VKTYYNEWDAKTAAWLRELAKQGHVTNGVVDERSITAIQPGELDGYERCHFFAGIGGWDYALRLAGWEPTRKVWTGSCPCQPFSAAGKRKGQADERHLWPDWFRLIRECRPDTIFGEQVESAIGHGWLDGVFADLEGEGYTCGAVVLGAHSVGAPHIRQRLWWVADSHGGRRDWFSQPDRQPLEYQQENTFGRHAVRCGVAGGVVHPNGSGWDQAQCASIPEQSCQAGYWSGATTIPCGDGKTRRIVTRLGLLADGVSHTMDSMRSIQTQKEFIDAAKTKAGPVEEVRILRKGDAAEAFCERAGRYGEILAEEVLRSPVYGGLAGRANQGCNTKEQQATIFKAAKECLRKLRFQKAACGASYRQQSAEQRTLKFEDAVPHLPHADALARMEGDNETSEAVHVLLIACASHWLVQHPLQPVSQAWQCVSRKTLQWAWEAGLFDGFGIVGCSPLVNGFEGRVTALKGMGNTIVPQVAAQFVRAFMECEPTEATA
jgi:DNA (cytosine-5)-methyltransferase 1